MTDSKASHARPTIVCLCGSMRFWQEFMVESYKESMAGHIVLLPVLATPGMQAVAFTLPLGELHCRKIDLADEVLFLNIDGYIGEATCRELAYALSRLGKVYNAKRIRFLEPEQGRAFLSENRARIGALIRGFGGHNDQYHHWPGTTPSDCGEPGRGVPALK